MSQQGGKRPQGLTVSGYELLESSLNYRLAISASIQSLSFCFLIRNNNQRKKKENRLYLS